jgi:LuxR family maltose regulon positive regulatory protein
VFASSGVSVQLTVVTRPELTARLERGLSAGVTVVSAPAGSGKTLMLRSWLDATQRSVAWVSVERSEDDPQHFWAAVFEALRAAAGSEKVGRLVPTPGFDGGAVTERLRSELAELDGEVVLVIDDLHELNSTEALRQLESLLERPPPALRVILAFRGEVPLGLHSLRLTGGLTELRAADLVFNVRETQALLAGSGIDLPDADAAALHERTEGWAAGLRLAALSLRGHPDPHRFVAEFSGTERTVADYLLAEVLERQTPDVRRLLLRTSVLERVSGPLADVLVDGSGSEAALRGLEERGTFVISLDGDRTWFRYHHLFADLLRRELRRTAPAEVAQLHSAAARWYAAHDYVVEAIGHAQVAGDWALAVGLLSDHYFSLTLDGRQATARGLLRSFPRDVMSADPQLALMLAADELAQGSLDASEAQLALSLAHRDVVPADRRRRFAVGSALVRLSLARRRGDLDSVTDLIPDSDVIEQPDSWFDIIMHDDLRAWALMNLGIVEAWSGRSAEAAQHLEQARELARRIGRRYLEVGCLAHWASTVSQRSFVRAQEAAREAISLAEQHGWGSDQVIAPALLTRAVASAQTGRFDEAEELLERAEATLRPTLEPALGFVLHAITAAVHLARGRAQDALAEYERAEQLRESLVNPPPLADQVRSSILHARLAAGLVGEVRSSLADLGEPERGRGEFQEVAAELALVDEDPQAALEALAPIIDGTAPVHHATVVIRALILEAGIHHRLGEIREAEHAFERALDLAEPDRLIMPFVHTVSRGLVAGHPRHRTAHGAFLAEITDVLGGASLKPVPGAPAPLLEPLTDVELRVLRFLPSNLTAPDIAGELYLSTNTVKTHLRHIYAKLDAHTRTEAVDRARAVGLLAPSGRHRRA